MDLTISYACNLMQLEKYEEALKHAAQENITQSNPKASEMVLNIRDNVFAG